MTEKSIPAVRQQNRAGIWVSILYVAITGNLLMALSPMFWTGYSEFLHFNDAVIGKLMSIESLGSTVATAAGALYMYREGMNLRYVAYGAITFYAAGNYATALFLHDPQVLTALRFICGLGSGTVFLTSATAITSLKNPSRLIAVFYGTPYMTSFVLAPMAHSIFAHWGFGTAFVMIGVAAICSIFLFPLYPPFAGRADPSGGENSLSGSSIGPLILVVLALLLQYIGNSGIWIFFDRLGFLSGHAPQTTANIVGYGTGMAIVGTALATVLVKSLKPLHGILLGTILLIVSTTALHFAASLPVFAGAVLMFNMMITFLTPFYFLLLIRTYIPAKAVIAGNVSIMLGFSLGPLLIGHTVTRSGFALSINLTVSLFVLSIAAVLVARTITERVEHVSREPTLE